MTNKIKEYYSKYNEDKKKKDLDYIISNFYAMIEIYNHRKRQFNKNNFFSKQEEQRNDYINYFREFKPKFERKWEYNDLPLDIRNFFENL